MFGRLAPPLSRHSGRNPLNVHKLRSDIATRARRFVDRIRRQPTRYVFVVASGRSGSTLVQGLLNALPGTLIRGENGFFLLPIFRGVQSTRVFRRIYGGNSDRTTSAYYGLDHLNLNALTGSLRRPIVQQLLGTTPARRVDVIGFKEVRWEQIELGEAERFFSFFEQVFPGARYVLVERDPAVVADSGHWTRGTHDDALVALRRGRAVRDYLRSSRPDRVYDIVYEVITGEDGDAADAQLVGLARFAAGADDNQTRARMREVLTVGHGPFPFGAVRRKR